MATEEDVRRIASGLPGVSEKPCYGTPGFYVRGRLFARIHDAPEVLVLWRASVEERDELIASAPDAFFTTDHYRNHASVLVRLPRIDMEELAELLAESRDLRAGR
ncbi:MmcQ/YjbR family DNA-binding protein [Nocardiopsis alba]|uniref:MmcQ/YjbR family DNA-binding protein n=1 Tax=Nocardiopsis alba TaxID=53437 RepID=UPI00366C7907